MEINWASSNLVDKQFKMRKLVCGSTSKVQDHASAHNTPHPPRGFFFLLEFLDKTPICMLGAECKIRLGFFFFFEKLSRLGLI